MQKIIGVILLVAGIFLLVHGHDLSRSLKGQLNHFASRITGSANDQTMYFYVGGAACCAVGLGQLFRSGKK